MNIRHILLISLMAFPAGLSAQGVDAKMLLHPPADSWPTAELLGRLRQTR